MRPRRLGRIVPLGAVLLLSWTALSWSAPRPKTTPGTPQEIWSEAYDPYFRRYSKRYFGPNFDWRWFKAQAIAESRLKDSARSHAGARGLMQIMPRTYAEIRKKNPHFGDVLNPRWNIAAGIYYDRYLYDRWRNTQEMERLNLTFASYNAGLGSILRAARLAGGRQHGWHKMERHAPRETRKYVRRIRQVKQEALSAPLKAKPDPRQARLYYLLWEEEQPELEEQTEGANQI